MRLTIHRGTKEVGGSCVEISTAQTRIILDVGLPLFEADAEPLNTFAVRRMTTEELQAGGYLTNAKGLFFGDDHPDAIFLSHAHLDHTGLLDHTQASIPVYASKGTSKMMLAGKIFAGQVEIPQDRFKRLDPEKPKTIGDIKITGYPVDHSIYGCMAFLIEACNKRILYTGDIRLHGRKPGMHQRLLKVLKDCPIDVLVMEGTHFGFSDGPVSTEYDLEDDLSKLVHESKGLVLASFSPQHVDRLVAFIRAAKKSNRQFVADVYTAFVLHLIHCEVSVPVPGQNGWGRVYYPKSWLGPKQQRSGTLADMFSGCRINMEEILAKPSQHLMIFRPSMLDDFEHQFPEATTCLYSRWNGYLKGDDWKQTDRALRSSGGRIIEAHTSGHIFSDDIVSFVNSIDPKQVIPIHTFEPGRFAEHFENTVVLQDGVPFTIEN